ncbi:response regulator [Pseudoduganella sp. UC29_106]|uniref:response regulator n=1 Tax=Pseudoduganella sp. UC29_106 TaxID=3374553 RepID=UPI00375707F5
MKVLIVDDDHLLADRVVRDLYEVGIEAEAFYSGEECIVSARRDRPSLILLDISMPGISGFETLRRLRYFPTLARTRVVAISSLADAASMFTIGSAGFDACVAKPIVMSEVLNQVYHQRGADSRP